MPDPLSNDYTPQMQACAEAIELGAPQYVLPSEHTAKINGIDFHYVDWGNDHLPHVVLLHGGALTAHTWDMACLLLRDSYHIIAPDQRGHGDTGRTPDDQLGDNSNLMGEDTVQLLSRHWIITDATGSEEHVRGPGVVGTQPVLRPGQRHEYTSACPLRTSMGTMHGTYTMERETGDRFQAVIAPFVLADPLTVN